MNIDKAIEILDSSLDNLDPWNEGEIGAAVKLGIEALKRHKGLKESHPFPGYKILPSETKD